MYVFLDNITFLYKGAQASVLDGLTLFVRSREIVAVIGPAGRRAHRIGWVRE